MASDATSFFENAQRRALRSQYRGAGWQRSRSTPCIPEKKLAVAMPRIAYLACVQLSHNPSTQVLEG
jgi:hypothetical protein